VGWKLGVKSPPDRSLRSCERLLMGFGLIGTCGELSQGLNNLLAWGLDKVDSGFPHPMHLQHVELQMPRVSPGF